MQEAIKQLCCPFSQGCFLALFIASEKGHDAIVEFLIYAGADIEARNDVSHTTHVYRLESKCT
jgi:ankyrin repeat protein